MEIGKKNIERSTIKEQVYAIIKENILNGTLKPGEWLQENKLADLLNVSRSPIREALKQLVGEGLLENIPNKGVFVKKLGIKDIYNIFEFREVMEHYAIEKSIKLITNKDIKVLNKISSELIKAYEEKDVIKYCNVDTKLHDFIYIMSDNEIIYEIVNNVFPLLQPFRIISLNSKRRFEESLDEHLCLINSLIEKDFNKAWDCSKNHLVSARDVIIGQLNTTES